MKTILPTSGWFRPGWFQINFAFALVFLGLCALFAQKRDEPRISGLVELYGVSASIMHGEEDEFAAGLLLEFLKPSIREIKTLPAKASKPRNDDLVIYLGSFESNPVGAKVFKSLGYSLNWENLSEGSFLLKTFRKEGKTTIFVTGKDRLGTLYAAQDLKNYYLRIDMGRVLLNELNLVERAQLKYRWFYNWDSRTNWDLTDDDGRFAVDAAVPGRNQPYLNSPDAFLRDMKKALDFMSEHRLNGLILWGFLRDGHGGQSAAQELCRYAQERGVRILPGVGLTSHGGFFYESNHQFNLSTWTKAHPELRSVDEKGNYRNDTLCPEKLENRQWLREGLQWLYRSFAIGGVSLETVEYFVCYSEDCKKARQAMGGKDPDSFKDLSRIVTFMAAEAQKLDSKTWVAYPVYVGFDIESIQNAQPGASVSQRASRPYPPEFVRHVPEFAICQWDLTKMLQERSWPSPFKAPSKHAVGLLRRGNVPSKSADELYWKRMEEVTHQAFSSNLEGVVIFGEMSPEAPNVELNYLTFAELAFNPAADLNEFFRFRVARRYGGEEPAKKLMKILDLLEDETGMLPANSEEALSLARQAAEQSDRSGKERWTKLIAFIEGSKKATTR